MALTATLAGCSREIESEPDAGASQAARISLTSAPVTEVENGYQTYLYSERDVDLVSRLSGGQYFEQGLIVKSLQVEVGDRVRAGQLLATLEDDEVLIELEAAQARADEANATFERIQELKQRQVVPEAEYDAALFARRSADAALSRAKLDLSRTRVRAPFAGVVARRYIREGQLIEGSTPLFRVTAMAPLRARLLVPERQTDIFRAKAPVNVRGVDGDSALGHVLVVGPTVDPASGTREVIIELAEPDGFRPGASVTIKPRTPRDATG